MSTTHIVGHDGGAKGDDALALARALAPTTDTRRIVAHVVEHPLPDLAPSDRFVEALREEAEAELVELRAGLRPNEELRVIEAPSIARGLHDLAEHEGASLVVVGPTHHGGVGKALLGTTADRLLHGSPCPVATAAPGFADQPVLRRIMLAYGGDDESKSALHHAVELARGARAQVDVITARRPVNAYIGHPGAAGMAAYVIEEAEREAERCAEQAQQALPDDVVGARTVVDQAAGHAITEAAGAQSADLIVMGSRAYGPVKRVLLGSTGRHVLHHAPCSVLVVPRVASKADPATPPAEREPAVA